MQPPTTATCPGDDALAAFVDRRLDAEKARALEAHVDTCPSCYQLLATYARTYSPSDGVRSGAPTSQSDGASGLVSHGALVERLQRGAGLTPGTLVGRYVVLDWVGEGGAGVVYAAYDPELDRKIALKLLQPAATLDQERLTTTLLREARAMAKLAHPNVMSVHDVGTYAGQVFIAMEFVDGGTLRRWLRDASRSTREILGVFLEAGRGLAAAHAAGIVHHDFKPENVLLGKDGRARVSDFGLASMPDEGHADPAREGPTPERLEPRPKDGRTRASTIGGTLAYMAPEHRRGLVSDARSDQYSFSVALYEALCGEHPFDHDTNGAEARPPTTRTVRDAHPPSQVPARIRRILLRGLSIAPSQRYPSMGALLADFDQDKGGRWKRAGLVAMVIVAVVSVAFEVRQRSVQSQQLLCTGAEERLKGVWDAARREAISGAFLATGKPFAADAWRGAEARLDAYARDWVAMRTDACRATRVRGEQSAALLDLRMACLDDRLKEMDALAEVFAHADALVVTNALAGAESLTRMARCADARSLTSQVRLPSNEAIAKTVEALRQELDQITAMEKAGKYKDALPLAARAVEGARATGFRMVEGETLFRYGHLQGQVGDLTGAEASLYGAAWASDAAGDDRTRAEVWGALMYTVANQRARYDLIPTFRDQGMAAIARLGGDDEAEAQLLQNTASALNHIYKHTPDEALPMAERALALWEKVYGPESQQVAQSLNNLGVVYMGKGAIDQALSVYRRALLLEENLLGANHPEVARVSYNIGAAHQLRLEALEAKPFMERAVEIADAAIGPRHPSLARYVNGLGEVYRVLGQYDSAIAQFERALAMREALFGPDHPDLYYSFVNLGQVYLDLKAYGRAIFYLEQAVKFASPAKRGDVAEAQLALAEALTGAGRDAKRAHQLATEARDTLQGQAKNPEEAQVLERAEAWLRTHP